MDASPRAAALAYLLPTIDGLLRDISPISAKRGKSYLNRTQLFGIAPGVVAFKAQGSRATPYSVQVFFKKDGPGWVQCSCPIGGNGVCKHSYAALRLLRLEVQTTPQAAVQLASLALGAPGAGGAESSDSTPKAPPPTKVKKARPRWRQRRKTPPTKANLTSLERHFRNTKRENYLHRSVLAFAEELSPENRWRLQYRHPSLSAWEALTDGPNVYPRLRQEVKVGIWNDILNHLDHFDAIEQKTKAREASRRAPPSHPALQDLHRRLLEARSQSLKVASRNIDPDEVLSHLIFSEAKDTLELPYVHTSPSGKTTEAILQLNLEGPLFGPPGTTLPEASSNIVLSALDAALDVLTHPSCSERRDRIAVHLETPLWQRRLNRLEALLKDVAPPDEAKKQEDDRQLGFKVLFGHDSTIKEVKAVLVRPFKLKNGYRSWNVSNRNLHPIEASLGADEKRAVDLLKVDPYSYHAPAPLDVLSLLPGHPRIIDKSGRPLNIKVGALTLGLTLNESETIKVRATVAGETLASEDLSRILDKAAQSSPSKAQDRQAIIDQSAGTISIVESFPKDPTRAKAALSYLEGLPKQALPSLLEQLPALESWLSLELRGPLAGQPIEASPRLRLTLMMEKDTLRVSPSLRLHPGLPAVIPGEGPAPLRGPLGDRRVFIERDTPKERSFFEAALESLNLPTEEPAFNLPLDEGLDLILTLQERPEVEVLWPKNKPTTVSASPSDLTLRIQSHGDWFGLKGELKVGHLGLSLTALLDAIRHNQRWIAIKGEGYVRISEALKKAMAPTALLSFNRGKKPPRISPLAGESLAMLEDAGVEVKATANWVRALGALRRAQESAPSVPPGLKATLRPYQKAGVEWLLRMALWSPGACLADDMGLGKTLQSLALALSRRDKGITLVVAPTSVGFNWIRECQRFTPDLNAVLYRGPGREALLGDLGPGSLVVTSYGLLLRDIEELRTLTLSTLIFDEAQALKNPNTKRSRGARSLEAGFTLALTGTPIENRVGEVWSLFSQIAPGLLGSQEAFRERFVRPIEGQQDESVKQTLAQVISPFIMRRRKSEVAQDLPARLEEVVEIPLSPREQTLYDQLRLEALRSLSSSEEGADRFSILSAITRLRQLACHPRLILPDHPGTSSKQSRLKEIAAELLEGSHRALVFSQFTGHLAIAKETLESIGAEVLYLDGRTPPAKRQALVDRFQGGEGDFFCISLKAGGTGLNLTGATWVLHLDPWWNPAVEDQATDRAHRIGQTEPVTVLRLVTRGTIEGEILKLHTHKRDLADALLSGKNDQGAMSTEALMSLLSDHGFQGTPAPEEPVQGIVEDITEAPEGHLPQLTPPSPSPKKAKSGPNPGSPKVRRSPKGASKPASSAPEPEARCQMEKPEGGRSMEEDIKTFKAYLKKGGRGLEHISRRGRRSMERAATNLLAFAQSDEVRFEDPGGLKDAIEAYRQSIEKNPTPTGRADLITGEVAWPHLSNALFEPPSPRRSR